METQVKLHVTTGSLIFAGVGAEFLLGEHAERLTASIARGEVRPEIVNALRSVDQILDRKRDRLKWTPVAIEPGVLQSIAAIALRYDVAVESVAVALLYDYSL